MTSSFSSDLSRRHFLKGFALVTTGLGLLGNPLVARAAAIVPRVQQFGGEVRDLNLLNTNTNESISTVFFSDGEYDRPGYNQLCHFMRDHHDNASHWMDPRVLTLLHDMQSIFDKRQIHIISGYRTQQTNKMLRRSFPGVAKDSFHMKGQAIDIRIPGIDTSHVRDVARILGVGGVGYYRRAHFVHVDSGPVRHWSL